jgi:hypothetical protein
MVTEPVGSNPLTIAPGTSSSASAIHTTSFPARQTYSVATVANS